MNNERKIQEALTRMVDDVAEAAAAQQTYINTLQDALKEAAKTIDETADYFKELLGTSDAINRARISVIRQRAERARRVASPQQTNGE